MKKFTASLLSVVIFAASLPCFSMAVSQGDIITLDNTPYEIIGENLFQSPDFAAADGTREAPGWYVGTNSSTAWDNSIPNPKTGENLIPLENITSGTSESKPGSSFYYANDNGNSSRSKYYLCENITSAPGSYWNGTNALLGYVPIKPGKTYYFSYNVSSWGSIANSSVRYGAINSDTYCNNASSGSIVWSGSGGVNVNEYGGNNMNQKNSWTKKEAVITADSDADYFFFNLYWLQDTSYLCVNGFYLAEVSMDYKITKKVSFNNQSIDAQLTVETDKDDYTLLTVLALYDEDGALHSISSKEVHPTDPPNVYLSLPNPRLENLVSKVFVWDRTCNLKPVTPSRPIPITTIEGGQFMPISDVQLLDGMFKQAQDLNVDYLLAINPDRLLAPSMDSSNLTPKADYYGGWESKKYGSWASGYGISGHSLGHWMSAVSTAWQATGNQTLKDRLDYTVSELARIQETTGSGYIGGINPAPFNSAFSGNINAEGFKLNNAWVPWYSVHKIYQGLIDAYTIGKNSQALTVVTKFADWAADGIKNLTDSQMQTMLITEHGGMNDVFAQLYSITNNESYLTAAIRFTHNSIIDPLSQGKDELTGKHANTQIPKIIGAASIYEQDMTKAEYRTASEFFWNNVVNHRTFVIGGNSVSEHFESVEAETLHKKTCESCNTYNMIKLTEHLYSWNHSSSYMDYVENALFNDILGAQDPATGNKMYFTSLLQGHYRVYGTPENSWWCCTGSGMENPGRYAKCIYYKDGSDLFVNLYIPSRVVWTESNLTFKMETNFPYSENVKITLEEGSGNASVNLRVPSWITSPMTAVVGGETYTAAEPGYLTINRSWTEGDTINITLPMGLSVYTSRDSKNKVAYKYGPIVLGAPLGSEGMPNDTQESELGIPDTTTSVPSLKTDSTNPGDYITPVDLSSLTFVIDGQYTSNGAPVTLVPFYSIHHQFHNVYWYLNSEADPYEKALNNITVDSVIPDGQQDEIGHEMSGKDSHNGSFVNGITTYYWRDAYGSADSYFSYKMSVDPNNKNYLYISYWGSDGDFKNYTRSFQISVDGTQIASQTIKAPSPGKPYNVFYDIPQSLTQGKNKITVKLYVTDNTSCAGGFIDMRITNKNYVELD